MKRRGVRLDERNEWQIWILCATFVASAGPAMGVVVPSSTTSQALGGGLSARVWATVCALGCLLALVGIAWHRQPGRVTVTGLGFEQVGLVAVGFSFLVYSVGVAWVTGPSAYFVGIIFAALGVLALKRSWNIGTDLRKHRATKG